MSTEPEPTPPAPEVPPEPKPHHNKGRPSGFKGHTHAPDKRPYYKKKKQHIYVDKLAAALAADVSLRPNSPSATSAAAHSPNLEAIGITQADRIRLYQISRTSVENFQNHLKSQLALAADRLTARMASQQFVDDLKPAEVAFATNIAIQHHQKLAGTGLTQGSITQVNNFYDSKGRTKEQIIRQLQGLPPTPSNIVQSAPINVTPQPQPSAPAP